MSDRICWNCNYWIQERPKDDTGICSAITGNLFPKQACVEIVEVFTAGLTKHTGKEFLANMKFRTNDWFSCSLFEEEASDG